MFCTVNYIKQGLIYHTHQTYECSLEAFSKAHSLVMEGKADKAYLIDDEGQVFDSVKA